VLNAVQTSASRKFLPWRDTRWNICPERTHDLHDLIAGIFAGVEIEGP
jgi:hypothetical protein